MKIERKILILILIQAIFITSFIVLIAETADASSSLLFESIPDENTEYYSPATANGYFTSTLNDISEADNVNDITSTKYKEYVFNSGKEFYEKPHDLTYLRARFGATVRNISSFGDTAVLRIWIKVSHSMRLAVWMIATGNSDGNGSKAPFVNIDVVEVDKFVAVDIPVSKFVDAVTSGKNLNLAQISHIRLTKVASEDGFKGTFLEENEKMSIASVQMWSDTPPAMTASNLLFETNYALENDVICEKAGGKPVMNINVNSLESTDPNYNNFKRNVDISVIDDEFYYQAGNDKQPCFLTGFAAEDTSIDMSAHKNCGELRTWIKVPKAMTLRIFICSTDDSSEFVNKTFASKDAGKFVEIRIPLSEFASIDSYLDLKTVSHIKISRALGTGKTQFLKEDEVISVGYMQIWSGVAPLAYEVESSSSESVSSESVSSEIGRAHV